MAIAQSEGMNNVVEEKKEEKVTKVEDKENKNDIWDQETLESILNEENENNYEEDLYRIKELNEEKMEDFQGTFEDNLKKIWLTPADNLENKSEEVQDARKFIEWLNN